MFLPAKITFVPKSVFYATFWVHKSLIYESFQFGSSVVFASIYALNKQLSTLRLCLRLNIRVVDCNSMMLNPIISFLSASCSSGCFVRGGGYAIYHQVCRHRF